MAHFAKVINGIVDRVIVAEPDFFDTFVDTSAGDWIQTSYNTRGNLHYGQDGKPDGGIALRGNYAGIGYIYDRENDVFYCPAPYPSWILNKSTWLWDAPVPFPADLLHKPYSWDEATQSWVAKELT
jgi:hypothetical protein